MPSGEVSNITNFERASMGIGFVVYQSPGSVYDTSKTDTLYIANFEVVGAPNNSLESTPGKAIKIKQWLPNAPSGCVSKLFRLGK